MKAFKILFFIALLCNVPAVGIRLYEANVPWITWLNFVGCFCVGHYYRHYLQGT